MQLRFVLKYTLFLSSVLLGLVVVFLPWVEVYVAPISEPGTQITGTNATAPFWSTAIAVYNCLEPIVGTESLTLNWKLGRLRMIGKALLGFQIGLWFAFLIICRKELTPARLILFGLCICILGFLALRIVGAPNYLLAPPAFCETQTPDHRIVIGVRLRGEGYGGRRRLGLFWPSAWVSVLSTMLGGTAIAVSYRSRSSGAQQ